jgi:hypothetical protein
MGSDRRACSDLSSLLDGDTAVAVPAFKDPNFSLPKQPLRIGQETEAAALTPDPVERSMQAIQRFVISNRGIGRGIVTRSRSGGFLIRARA